jgi:hypothetical protein
MEFVTWAIIAAKAMFKSGMPNRRLQDLGSSSGEMVQSDSTEPKRGKPNTP